MPLISLSNFLLSLFFHSSSSFCKSLGKLAFGNLSNGSFRVSEPSDKIGAADFNFLPAASPPAVDPRALYMLTL